MLFGSLLTLGTRDVLLAGGASVLAVAGTLLLGQRWLAVGFDPSGARALGLRSSAPEIVLLALVALTAVAALSALGALLATALLVVPAATARLFTKRLRPLQALSLESCQYPRLRSPRLESRTPLKLAPGIWPLRDVGSRRRRLSTGACGTG